MRKRQFIQKKQQAEQKNKDTEITETPALDDEDDIDQFQGKEFAKLYNDLALTYQGMEDLEYAQEYLVLAIQCLEKLQEEGQDDYAQSQASEDNDNGQGDGSKKLDKV